ncbi:MAG: glucose-6-phosphate dehydrogenase assembly protein OpcA [Opitutales bacterium]|nr:glucose-6-phosphate dehydrogenase assembly protein OpcA [Opitutales bacterium]
MSTEPISLLDVLPGLRVPVEDVPAMLAHMWDSDPEDPAAQRIHSFRASQMNLVLHFGLATGAEEARRLFDTAIEFAQRYPCRLVVLCPGERQRGGGEVLDGKVFSQCYVGKNLRDMCCCEALALGYNTEDARFLENQMSLWLETDLPVYHWFHRVPPERITDCYASIVSRVTRALYDSDVDPDLADAGFWAEEVRARNLAYARTLPMRQHIGQFLSVYAPESIGGALESVEIACDPAIRGEAAALLDWMRGAVLRCTAAHGGDAPAFRLREDHTDGGGLKIEWRYGKEPKYFLWEYNTGIRTGRRKGCFGGVPFDQPLHIDPLPRAVALAEALFF